MRDNYDLKVLIKLWSVVDGIGIFWYLILFFILFFILKLWGVGDLYEYWRNYMEVDCVRVEN